MDYHEILKSQEQIDQDEKNAGDSRAKEMEKENARKLFLSSTVGREVLQDLNLVRNTLLKETIESASNIEISDLALRLKLAEIQTLTKTLNLVKSGKYAYGIDDSSTNG